MFGQLGKQQRGELAGGLALWVRCSVCEGGLGGVRREEGDRGRAVVYKRGYSPGSGHGRDSHEPRSKARSGIPGRNGFKERFHGLLSTLSCQRYLGVTIQHNLLLPKRKRVLKR